MRLHFLPGASKLGEDEVPPPSFVWRNDLAQDLMEVLEFLSANDNGDSVVRLVSAETQHLIREGHEFDITADSGDPEDLPDLTLWELRHATSCIAALVAAAAPQEVLDADCEVDGY